MVVRAQQLAVGFNSVRSAGQVVRCNTESLWGSRYRLKTRGAEHEPVVGLHNTDRGSFTARPLSVGRRN